MTEADAAAVVRRLYGRDAQARALPGEFDDNFRVTASDGSAFVLKGMHPAREPGLVEMQCAALAHLQARAPHLPVPRVVPTLGGEPWIIVPGPNGTPRIAWMLTWLGGTPLAEARPRTAELLRDLGRLLAEVDDALSGFEHREAHRELQWDLSRALAARGALGHVCDAARRALAERTLARFEAEVVPALHRLRRRVVHGDANDHNVLVGPPRGLDRSVTGLLDFGDMHHGILVAEPAVAAAYALLGQADPLAAAAAVVGGYHAALPLDEAEIAVLWPLVGARLAVSVAYSAFRAGQEAADPYVTVSEAPAWDALERLDRVHPRFAHYALREACGLSPVPEGPAVVSWLGQTPVSPVLDADPSTTACLVFDLGVGSPLLGAEPDAARTGPLTERLFGEMARASAPVGVGRYDEARGLYVSLLFGSSGRATDERRTVHLGIDLFVEPGATVRAALPGVVHLVANNAAPQDYGPLVVLRHETPDGTPFYSLYGHLSEDTLPGLAVGQRLEAGEAIGRVGSPPTNGDWPPHLHLQLILDLLDCGADFPGVALPSRRAVWTSLSPDPNLLLRIPEDRFPAKEPSPAETLAARSRLLGPNLSVSYRRPLKIVRGFAQHLYDECGRAFLDVYNNVPLVGHSHPRVVRAVRDQAALLNTNTRYLHDTILCYAERLAQRLPEPLRVFYFVNSGSEANELALRLARARSGAFDVIVLEHAYHGHTTTLVDVSPYKFDGPGGRGRRGWVHVATLPDTYRGRYRRDDPLAGPLYARQVAAIVDRLRAEGRGPAAFLAETLPSVAGQVVLPPGYLAEAYRHVRAAGGVAIADEVQTGFGRPGERFWAFESQGVVPDVLVLGKPIGNGFPLGAVVTTREIARAFDNGMEFFSTFGGNPVSCAAGLAVLDAVEQEGLQERAARVGGFLLDGLRRLQEKHALIGDARGAGLFLGIELVRDRTTQEPAAEEADYVVNRLRERGVLTGTDGYHHNVLKIRPPLVFTEADAELFLETLDEVLAEDGARPGLAR
jgi:4-aminobutyrate aminotransferase-like enzyme/Ser/Thr protein kinase RdoA (MazF antagonist)/murein DD-endopeptidase MepM/ murein hydrolase activator NlpD